MKSVHNLMCLFTHNSEPSDELIAATVYPDAICAYTGARQYSHFEKTPDGFTSFRMQFPSNMHAGKALVQRLVQACPVDISEAKPCVIGEPVSVAAFERSNRYLRAPMLAGISYHLTQEKDFYGFINAKVDCRHKYEGEFGFNGESLDDEDMSRLVDDIENHGIYVLAHALYKTKGITANQAWFDEHIKPALEKNYPADLVDEVLPTITIEPEIDELITAHDWSQLDNGPVSLSEYAGLYGVLEAKMRGIDYRLGGGGGGDNSAPFEFEKVLHPFFTREVPEKSRRIPQTAMPARPPYSDDYEMGF